MKLESKTGFFSDLDQTLFYSARSVGEQNLNSEFTGLVCIETNKTEPAGFMTFDSVVTLSKISHLTNFIPTTTRTTEQYERILFPKTEIEYAITTNGAIIIHHGVEDEAWLNKLHKDIAEKSEDINQVYNFWVDRTIDISWVTAVNKPKDIFVYFMVIAAEVTPSFVEELEGKAAEWNYVVSIQGRKIYFIPKFLTKTLAVQEISNRLELDYIISAGDSNLDQPMLELADFALRPSHGSLHEKNYVADNLTIVPESGVYGGEQILNKVLESLL